MPALYQTKTCGTCQHFHRDPSQPNGECRAVPPGAHLTPLQSLFLPAGGKTNGDQFNVRVMYPPMPPNFKACSQFAEDIYADDGTKPQQEGS